MKTVITITCKRDLVTEDVFDFQIYHGRSFNVIAAYNAEEGFINEFNTLQPTHTKYGATEWMIE